MKVILEEVVHISPFVFVQVGFQNVSGEPRLIRPAERGTRDTTSPSSRPDARCMQAIGWYLSRREAEVQKAKRMALGLLQLSERSEPKRARLPFLCLNWPCRRGGCSGGVHVDV